MKNCTIALLFLLVTGSICLAQEHINKDKTNSAEQQQKPYVIMISSDGFRYDYAEKYQAANLLRLSAQGVRAASMIPSFPSVTFPNHYTLATGLYPSHTGLVNNNFYDPIKKEEYAMSAISKVRDGSWYGGTPLWVLAEQQHMLSASLFWVGSEAEIKGTRPTYYYNYDESLPLLKRIQIVKDWLSLPADKRPHLIMFYLSEPDHSGHAFGPDAPETEHAVKVVDEVINELTNAVKKTGLPVNFIFVSDHGMTAVDRDHALSIPASLDMTKVSIPSSGTMVDIHVKDKADIQPIYEQLKRDEKDYKAYLKTNMPEHFHYSAADDQYNRIGDILLIPEWPKVFSKFRPGMGYHGFDPLQVKDMHATFFAWGPAIKSGIQIPSFENVNVYPLVAEILGLTITEPIDGKKEVLQGVLK
jgi:predicted AlkP superfamily pyrophosphatase or phosphodiesterase